MAIDDTLVDDMKETLSNSADGSSDKTLFEKEVVTVKLLHKGEPKFMLVGVAHPSSSKAEDVHEAITKKCKEMGLDLNKCCVVLLQLQLLMGRQSTLVQSGILSRFQTEMPWMLTVHCVAHRLELALKDAFKKTYFVDVIDLMMQIYYMFQRSAKK